MSFEGNLHDSAPVSAASSPAKEVVMKTIGRRRYEMLIRVRDFGRTYGKRFPDSTYAGTLLAAIDAVVEQLGDHTVSSLCAARDATVVRAQAREALHDRLDAMSRTAQAFGAGTPAIQEKFTLPEYCDDQTLLATGRLFARDAREHEKEFVGHGLPATVLADLEGLVSRFAEAISQCDAGRDEHTAARAGTESAIATGLDAVRKLDVLVRNVLRDDPMATAAWERDRRVQWPRKKEAAAPDPTPASPVTPVPTPSAAPPVTTDTSAV